MKKTFALPLVAALLLAACSNPADGSSAYVRKGVPISWDMDLDGYEEAPKDSTYGINWVYYPKELVDAVPDALTWKKSGVTLVKLKPVEFHASDANFKFAWLAGGQGHYASGAYKCIVYFKNGEDVVYEDGGFNYTYIPENVEFVQMYKLKFIRTHHQSGDDIIESKTTSINGADTFKCRYGQY